MIYVHEYILLLTENDSTWMMYVVDVEYWLWRGNAKGSDTFSLQES